MKTIALVPLLGLVMLVFGFARAKQAEPDVRKIIAGEWRFTPAQAERLNRTKPASLAAPIFEIFASIGAPLMKWSPSNEPLDESALRECQFVDLHHNGTYVAIAWFVEKALVSYVIEKNQGKYRIADVPNWGSRLIYSTPQASYVLSLERLQSFCRACPNGFFPRIYDFENGQLTEVSKQHREFYANDFAEDVGVLVSIYEGRKPAAAPPVTGSYMVTDWIRYGYYDRLKATVGLAEAVVMANHLFGTSALSKPSIDRISALLDAYSPGNASAALRKEAADELRQEDKQLWERAKKSIQDELLRYK